MVGLETFSRMRSAVTGLLVTGARANRQGVEWTNCGSTCTMAPQGGQLRCWLRRRPCRRRPDVSAEVLDTVTRACLMISTDEVVYPDFGCDVDGALVDVVVSGDHGAECFEPVEDSLDGVAVFQILQWVRYVSASVAEAGTLVMPGARSGIDRRS